MLSFAVASAKDFVVVIDPGHGGRDAGALGQTTNEKTINLAVAKALGEKVSSIGRDVRVVYTRDKDVFIPLNERANIANKAKGDLFISIHVNSIDSKNKNARTIKGAQVYTLGLHKTESNLAVARRENSVMTLEKDYSETYRGFDPNSVESYIAFELSQSRHLDRSINFAALAQNQLTTVAGRSDKGVRQAGFWVLHATCMPAVLVELDFICNPESERFLASRDGQDKMSDALCNAVASYYEMVTGNDAARKQRKKGSRKSDLADEASDKPAKESAPKNENRRKKKQKAESVAQAEADNSVAAAAATDKPEFRVQIYMSDKLIATDNKMFDGLEGVSYYRDGNYYKYTVGSFPTRGEAVKLMKELNNKFSGAFVIEFLNGTRVK